MRADWRRRRGIGAMHPMHLAVLGGIGTVLGAVAILGFAAFLALSGAL